MDEEDARCAWAALPHRDRSRACRLALIGRRHPDSQVEAAAAAWASVVLANRRRSSLSDIVENLIDLMSAYGLAREHVLDGRREHDHNWAVRFYARRIAKTVGNVEGA